MARVVLAIFLMGLAPPVLGQLFGGSSGNLGDLEATVAVVTEANYEEALRQSRSRPWILEFYAPWCKHCQAYAPVYKEAAEKVPALRFAKVDATAETAIRDANGVSGYPTLKLLIDGYVRDYKGARGPEGFEYLARTLAPPAVVKVTGANQVKSLLAESTVSFVLVEADGGSPKAAAAFGRVAKRMQALVPFASVPASELVAGAGARALELELELERAGAGAPVQELAAELAAAPRELLAKAPFVLKLDKGESPLPYPMADALWDDERGEDAAVGLLTAWAAGHRFTLVSKLDSRAFFELGRAGKMLVCGIVDPNVDKQEQQWREALLALARPGSELLDHAAQEAFFFGVMDGTEEHADEYLAKFGVPPGTLPAFVVFNFLEKGDEMFYNEFAYESVESRAALPEDPAALAAVLSGIVSETVYPQYEGLYGMPDQFWRMSAQQLTFLKAADGLPRFSLVAPVTAMLFAWLVKCACFDEDEEEEELRRKRRERQAASRAAAEKTLNEAMAKGDEDADEVTDTEEKRALQEELQALKRIHSDSISQAVEEEKKAR